MTMIRSSIAGRRYGLNFLGCYYVEDHDATKPSAEVYTSGDRKFPDSPWCDKDLRIAANKAIDREAINEAFYVGKAEIAPQWFHLPELKDSWDPSWPERYKELLGYDPEGAREILEEHGEPVQIQVYALDDVSEAVANMLADVGFEVEMLSMGSAQFAAQARERQFSNVILHDNVASEIITSFEPTGYANTRSGRAVAMVEWDTMYEEVLAELDDERRAQLWREFGDLILDEAMLIPLVSNYTEFVVNPAVVCGYTNPGANVSTVWVFTAYIEAC
jgi:ABC-type transport system substrate-binding protein